MNYFHLVTPEGSERPLLVEIPHAGLEIPPMVANEFCVTKADALADSDPYVDKLFDAAPSHGATLLVAKTSRYVIDLNRAPSDLSTTSVSSGASNIPRGVLWATTVDGRPLLREPLTSTRVARRIELFHKPYHQVLKAQLERLRKKYDYVILLACHSMPSLGAGLSGASQKRADIVPGWRGGQSCHPLLVEVTEAHFREAGLSVEVDRPYRGGWTTELYGDPGRHCHAIQLEINRALYLDEESFRIKQQDFSKLNELLMSLLDRLSAIELPKSRR